MKRALVIGWPISHSRSPLIHNYWLRHYGIAGSYDRQPVPPDELGPFLRHMAEGGLAGCNITIPHKEKAVAHLDVVDAFARRLGAVNTVWVRDGKTHGTSSDGQGFLASLAAAAPGFSIQNARVLVLGAGGAARAIVAALVDAGAATITVSNRTRARAEALLSLGPGIVGASDGAGLAHDLAACDLLINTTALGMTGQPALALDLAPLKPSAVVADIVYTPLVTPLLRQAQSRGHVIVPGLGMLLHQAATGFELWFGRKPEVTAELYDLVARDIDPDHRP